jgi:type IV secretory pathway VirJ component
VRHRRRHAIAPPGWPGTAVRRAIDDITATPIVLIAVLAFASPLARADEAGRFGERMPPFRYAFRDLAPASASPARDPGGVGGGEGPDAPPPDGAGVGDLPLIEVPATAGHSDALAFIATGDGGWARLDGEVAGVLAARGVPVVGLDTLRYYWHPRSPEESAGALERILRHYLTAWQKQRALLIGYSRGADVLPFMASRLPADLGDRVDLIALLGPGPAITFQFHFTDWVSESPRGNTRPVQPEIEKLRGKKLLCVYGSDEPDSICPRLPDGLARLYELPGGHHFDGNYRAIAERILTESGH